MNGNLINMFGTIYRITNIHNGKIYIGQTVRSINSRWVRHKRDAIKKNSSLAIHGAIRKYGIKNFKIEIVEECKSLKEMNDREIFHIKHLNSMYPNGYNLTPGGYNTVHSQETRDKISKALKGKPSPNKGKKQKKSTIRKRTESLRGKKLSDKHKEKLSMAKKKPIVCIETGIVYPSTKEAGKAMNIFPSNIFKVLSGQHKRAKGYSFKYA
jgi:group I intron endonuclease